MDIQVIHLHPQAPAKPAEGAACNGCGVCCASEPCPAGVLLSGRRVGACDALQWWPATGQGAGSAAGRYRCGLAADARAVLPLALRPAAPLLARLSLRMISAGSGCDCSLQVEAVAGPARAGPRGAADTASQGPV